MVKQFMHPNDDIIEKRPYEESRTKSSVFYASEVAPRSAKIVKLERNKEKRLELIQSYLEVG